jgi:hypothetical protein
MVNRDETGRFMVISFKTGKKYFVEPINLNAAALEILIRDRESGRIIRNKIYRWHWKKIFDH